MKLLREEFEYAHKRDSRGIKVASICVKVHHKNGEKLGVVYHSHNTLYADSKGNYTSYRRLRKDYMGAAGRLFKRLQSTEPGWQKTE